MQIISLWDNLHEIWKPNFWVKQEKNVINLLPAEFAQGAVKVKE